MEQVFLTSQKLEMNMPQMFKTKCIVNFPKYRSRKKVRFGGVKIAKSIKIEENEELIAGHQEIECLWNVLSLPHNNRSLRKISRTPKLFWNQPFRGVVDLSYIYS